MKEKKWKTVRNFSNYEIHEDNGIRNKKTQRILKGRLWHGYPKVTLMKDGKKHERRIHKLVAEHFHPNPNKLPIVDHKNGNRSDHRASNLRWASPSDNQKFRYAVQRIGGYDEVEKLSKRTKMSIVDTIDKYTYYHDTSIRKNR
jgi:hypothetical protein